MVKKVVTKTVKTVTLDGKKKSTTTKKTTSGSKNKKTTKKKAVKKVAKKKSTRKKSTRKPSSSVKMEKRDEILIENFVGLQHAMTNLSIKFGEMSQNISKLLSVFEMAAKDLARTEKQVDVSFDRKLDSLIDQNKTIAKGLVLMDGKLKAQMQRGPAPEAQPAPRPQMPTMPTPTAALPQAPATPNLQMPSPAPQSLQAPQGSPLPQAGQPSFPATPVNKPKPLPQL